MKFESAGKTTTVRFIDNDSQFLCIEMYENGGNFNLDVTTDKWFNRKEQLQLAKFILDKHGITNTKDIHLYMQ